MALRLTLHFPRMKMRSRKFFWIILAVCVFSTVATLLQLLVVYLMSLADLPDRYAGFRSALVEATDVDAIKTACSLLAQWNESEREDRIKLLIYAPLIALLTSTVCAALAGWALATTRNRPPPA